MAVWGPIQTLPRALLGFLQLKNSGQNPVTLSDLVQPQADMVRWWLQTNADNWTLGSYVGPTANGFRAFSIPGPIVVPNGEWWWVKSVTMFQTTAAPGDELRSSIAYRAERAGFTKTALLCPGYACQDGDYGASAGSDFWLPPGAEILLNVEHEAGVTTSVDCTVNYARLPA